MSQPSKRLLDVDDDVNATSQAENQRHSKSLSPGRSPNNSRGAKLLRLLEKDRLEQGSSLFSVSATSQQVPYSPRKEPSKKEDLLLLRSPQHILSPSAEPSLSPLASGKRILFSSSQSSQSSSSQSSSSSSQPSIALPPSWESLYDVFLAIDTVLHLMSRRGESAWWSLVRRHVFPLLGREPSLMCVGSVIRIWQDVWGVEWVKREGTTREELQLRWRGVEGQEEERRKKMREKMRDDAEARGGKGEVEHGPLPERKKKQKQQKQEEEVDKVEQQRNDEEEEEDDDEIQQRRAGKRGALALAEEREKMLQSLKVTQEEVETLSMMRLAEEVRGICAVNKRYRWPMETVATKVGRTKEATEDMLRKIQSICPTWCAVIENEHADGGTYLVVQKSKFSDIMHALTK